MSNGSPNCMPNKLSLVPFVFISSVTLGFCPLTSVTWITKAASSLTLLLLHCFPHILDSPRTDSLKHKYDSFPAPFKNMILLQIPNHSRCSVTSHFLHKPSVRVHSTSYLWAFRPLCAQASGSFFLLYLFSQLSQLTRLQLKIPEGNRKKKQNDK